MLVKFLRPNVPPKCICYLLFDGFYFSEKDINIQVFAVYHFVVIYKLIEQNTLIKNGQKYVIDDDSDLT